MRASHVIQPREEMHLLVKQAHKILVLITEIHVILPPPILSAHLPTKNALSPTSHSLYQPFGSLQLSSCPGSLLNLVPPPGRSLHISKKKGRLLPVHLSPQQLTSCRPTHPIASSTFCTWEGRQTCNAPGDLNSL